MKKIFLTLMIITLFAVSGCKTLMPGIQIVSNEEAGAGPATIAGIIAKEYVKIKYADKIHFLIKKSDAVLNAPNNKEIEETFNRWKDSLANLVKDPEGRALVSALLKCYDIKIDGRAALDWGGRDKAIRTVKMFKSMLESNYLFIDDQEGG